METNQRPKEGRCTVPTQEFNGKQYYLYPNERYFSKGVKRLHRVVWEHYNGKIPKGYHIHHVDGNTQNNAIENLQLIEATEHLKMEGRLRSQNKEWFESFWKAGVESAKSWHASKEGIEWHSISGKKSWESREYKTLECQQCGTHYQTRHAGASKYCHPNCKAKALRARRKGL
jgi:hypothetical protein